MKDHRLPPAFPPATKKQEEAYVEKMIKRDKVLETMDKTLPVKKT